MTNMTGCTNHAEWALLEEDIYMITYSCTDHLSEMVSDETKTIHPYKAGDQICCHIDSEES